MGSNARDHEGRGDGAGGSRRDLDLFDLIALLWAQKFLAIIIALLIFIPIALFAVTSLKPSYEAVSRLLVIQDDNDLAPGAAGSGGAFTLDQVMQSEAEILNSDAVRRLAIEQRSGAVGPQQLKLLRDGFSVSRSPSASLLTATFEHSDPVVAANTLNAIVDAYLAYRIEVLIGGVEGGVEERLARAERVSAMAEADLRRFLEEHGISDFATERAGVLARLSDLEARRMAAEAEAAQARALAGTLASRIAGIPDTIELYVENSVTGQLLDLQVRRIDLRQRYQDDAPPVQAVEREIEALERFIAAGGANGQGQRRTGVNPVWQDLESARLQQEAFAAGQTQLAASLARQITQVRAEADRLRALGPEHDRLVRAAQARAEAAGRLSAQAADASARRALPPGAADSVRIVERAEPPSEARSMRNIVLAAGFVLAVAVGAFAGLVRGYLVEVRDIRPAPRSPQPPRRDPPPQPAPAVNRQAAPAPAPAVPHLPVLARVSRQPVSAAR
jgi:polysaccharide biosynthesis protein PslE